MCRFPGILGCSPRPDSVIDPGTLLLLRMFPAGILVSAPPPPSKEDLSEFESLKGKITDADAPAYVKHRNDFFGSEAAYRAFAAAADAELDADKRLRGRIEHSGDTRRVLYRWVRKAMLNAGVEDPAALILAGATPELKEAIKRATAQYGAFSSGGFNPRPKKDAKYRYRLGTISEHGLGRAIDISSKSNPIISLADWAFIEKTAGKTVVRTAPRWKSDPGALWDDIDALNNAFVKAIAARSADERKKHPDADPLKTIFKGHGDLKGFSRGFFTLPRALVVALHGAGFLWGATFSNAVDLHHFELQ